MAKRKSKLLLNTGRRAILETLEKSVFLRHNFAVEFDDVRERAALVEVTFAPDKRYFFKLLKAPGYPREPCFISVECPGKDLGETVRYERKDFAEALAALENWMGLIVDDCRHASPLFDDFLAFRQELRAEVARHLDNGRAHAAPALPPDLEARLDALGRRIEQLEQRPAPAALTAGLEAKLEALCRRLEQLEQQGALQGKHSEQLQAQVNALAKGPEPAATNPPWFKPTGTKVVE